MPYNYKQPTTRNIVVTWGEVKDKVRAVVERGEPWHSQPSGARLRPLYEKPTEPELWDTHWEIQYRTDENGRKIPLRTPEGRTKRKMVKEYLSSGADISYWLKNGFRSEEFENLAEKVPAALQNRPHWSDEEGDVDLGRMAGGWDDFYLGMKERPAKPGVHVQIEMAFACGCSQNMIEQYGAWVNSLLGSMEAYGIDMVIDLWMPLDSLFVGSYERVNTLVRVKNANEVSDFTDWSILFSPAGFRQVGFAALCVAGDKVGRRVTGNYGMTIGGKTWGLNYDRENSVVTITCNQRAYAGEAIPFEALTKLAVEAGLIPDPEKVEV